MAHEKRVKTPTAPSSLPDIKIGVSAFVVDTDMFVQCFPDQLTSVYLDSSAISLPESRNVEPLWNDSEASAVQDCLETMLQNVLDDGDFMDAVLGFADEKKPYFEQLSVGSAMAASLGASNNAAAASLVEYILDNTLFNIISEADSLEFDVTSETA